MPGNLNFGNLAEQPLLNGRGIFLYLQHAPDSHLRRVLEWTPQVAGHYLFCYAAAEPGAPAISSTQRCIDLDVKVSSLSRGRSCSHELSPTLSPTLACAPARARHPPLRPGAGASI